VSVDWDVATAQAEADKSRELAMANSAY
jgi:hypothetical protein